ncbi:hypothetical protein [Providencia sp.]|nr:hypothetical protein [Providencia sp.]
MTQAHKQQYKYKLTSDSFKEKSNDDLKVIIPVIVFAAIYLLARI